MSGIDFSDEGLMAEAEAKEAEAPEAPVDPEVPAEPEAQPEEEVAEVVEPEAGSDWQKRYEEAQRIIGRQSGELGELRKAVESIRETQERQAAPQSPGTQQLVETVAADPQGAFLAALQYAPESVPNVIAEIRSEHGDQMAEMASAAYAQILADARAEQVREEIMSQITPVQQQYQSQQLSEASFNVANNFLSGGEVDRSELEVLMPDIEVELQNWADVLQRDNSPEMLDRALRSSYYAARARNEQKIIDAKRSAEASDTAAKRAAASEAGTPGTAQRLSNPSSSEADAIANAIVSPSGAARVSDLFSGLS